MTIITKTNAASPRIGLFEIPRRVSQPAEQFEAQLNNVKLAEDLGINSYWAAQAHFSAIGSPSSLSVLAAATQRTEHIRLGTAVVTLAFEDPLRLAETSAVVNSLSHDRLELGVGKGNSRGLSAAAYRAFQYDESQRDTLFEQQRDLLRQAFHHAEQDSYETTWDFYPAARGLDQRIWQATSSIATAQKAGALADGLQLHSVGPQPLGETQHELVNAYLDELPTGVIPRIAVARMVLPAKNNQSEIDEHHLVNPAVDTNVITGSPQDVAEQLLADATVQSSTDLLFRIPLPLETKLYRDTLRTLAREVTPFLAANWNQTGNTEQLNTSRQSS